MKDITFKDLVINALKYKAENIIIGKLNDNVSEEKIKNKEVFL